MVHAEQPGDQQTEKGQTMRETLIPTATANYRSHQRQIKALLADIRLALAKHARCQARDPQWGYAGDMERVKMSLEIIKESLAG
jgi:hypothetical protein